MSGLIGTQLQLLDERDPRKVEIRLVAISEVYVYERDSDQRDQLREEYQRLHAHWMNLKAADDV